MAVVFAFLGEGLNLVEFLSLAFLFLIAGQYDWMMLMLCLLNVRGFERDEYISRYDRWPMINISSTLLPLV